MVCGVVLAKKAAVEMARRQGTMGRKVSIFDAKRKQTMKVEAPVILRSHPPIFLKQKYEI